MRVSGRWGNFFAQLCCKRSRSRGDATPLKWTCDGLDPWRDGVLHQVSAARCGNRPAADWAWSVDSPGTGDDCGCDVALVLGVGVRDQAALALSRRLRHSRRSDIHLPDSLPWIGGRLSEPAYKTASTRRRFMNRSFLFQVRPIILPAFYCATTSRAVSGNTATAAGTGSVALLSHQRRA